MKKIMHISVLILVIAMFLCIPARAKDPGNAEPAGVLVDGSVIKCGENVPLLWGVLGPPDQLTPNRGKESSAKDYVKLDYYSYGISFDINKKNLIQGILVQQVNKGVTLKNCPFSVGQKFSDVTKAWGEPEKQTDDLCAYWKRGVYFGVNPAGGSIKYIFISFPGSENK